MNTPDGFGPDPFGGAPVGHNPFGAPPVISAPTPAPKRQDVNRLATLSVVFAFVFAPVGAVLGHLALSQIRRTSQRGRDRALIGIVLSYLVIVIVVVSLVVWMILDNRRDPQASASSGELVKPVGLSNLLLTLDEIKTIAPAADLWSADDSVGFAPDANLQVQPTECLNAYSVGVGPLYLDSGSTASSARQLMNGMGGDTGAASIWERVTVFKDAASARDFVMKLTEQWSMCERSVAIVYAGGGQFNFEFGRVRRVGPGDSMVMIGGKTPNSPAPESNERLTVAKSNVVVDVLVRSEHLGDVLSKAPETMATQILARIPD